MPSNLLLYGILVVALAIGFALGRSMRRRSSSRSGKMDPGFYQSINYLLNDEQDLAVDSLIEQLGIDESTFDTYLALGALVRRRGEVDKAINIHQNLLARPDLSATKRAQAELELANDYLGAGLLGRAEQLLVDMLQRLGSARDEASRKAKQQAQVLLVGLYERESDWTNALSVVKPLLKLDPQYPELAGHFCCEIALARLEQPPFDQAQLAQARQALIDGRKFAPNSARVALVSGQLELAEFDDGFAAAAGKGKSKASPKAACKAALKYFDKALQLDADLAIDLLPLVERACELLEDTTPLAKFASSAVVVPDGNPEAANGSPVQLLLTQAQLLRDSEGDAAAHAMLLSALAEVTSVKQLSTLLANLDAQTLSVALPAGLHETLVQHLGELAGAVRDFRCGNCGFSSSTRHWRCPSCQQWGEGRAVI